jgi:hypothetical protein
MVQVPIPFLASGNINLTNASGLLQPKGAGDLLIPQDQFRQKLDFNKTDGQCADDGKIKLGQNNPGTENTKPTLYCL